MTRPYHATLTLLGLTALIIFSGSASAQETFIAPEQHTADRYEGVWRKNPFILKTAPVVEEKKSFARDLVLENAFQVQGVTTVVIANAKTKESFRIKTSEAASNGMKIRSVMLKDAKKDSYVEIELHGESAVLRYDENHRKHLIASKSARGNRGVGEAGGPLNPNGQPVPNANGEPMLDAGPGAVSKPAQRAGGAAPTIRPPLPQRVNPEAAPGSPEPTSIRPPGPPGPRMLPMPSRGTPTKTSRRFFTAPVPAPPPDAAPAPAP